MKRTIIVGSTLLLSSLVCGNVAAEIEGVSGANLKKICESYRDIPSNPAEGMCLGYVVGVMSMMEYINVVCRPVKSTHSQAALVVQKYLADHPEKLHINAGELVLDALQEAFPCTDIPPSTSHPSQYSVPCPPACLLQENKDSFKPASPVH